MRKITLILLAFALTLTACESSVDEDAIREEIRAEIEQEAETAADEVESIEEVEPPEPEPEPEPDTGDYSSRMEYVDEVVDSSDKVSSLLGTASESASAVADGSISPGQFAELMTTAREVLGSHIEFFETRTPPEGFENSQRAFLRAWHIFDDAFAAGQTCGRDMDISACERAASLMEDGAAAMGEATSMLPSS